MCALCEKVLASCCDRKEQVMEVHIDNHYEPVYLCKQCAGSMRWLDKCNALRQSRGASEHSASSEKLPAYPPIFCRQEARMGRGKHDDDREDLL